MAAHGKSIVSKGKTVKEAVALALDLLSERLDEVNIEVMETESKGILGLGSKPAVVRVTVQDKVSAATPQWADLEQAVVSLRLPETAAERFPYKQPSSAPWATGDLPGCAWVQDGQIGCQDAPEKYPMVTPGNGMKFYKNDEPIEKTIVIHESDRLKVELEDETREPSWEVSLSPNKMEAFLKIVPGCRIHRKLKDKPPQTRIQLEVLEEKTEYADINTDFVMEKLREMGIVYGVDYTEVARASVGGEAGTFVIASGKPPVPGQHGYFAPLLDMEVKKGFKQRTDGSVDYREMQEFPSVEAGHVIGTIEPPVPGAPGNTVTGEVVLPPEALPFIVRAGLGVFLVENETKVVAVDAGHLDIKVKGRSALISVVPKLIIDKDVDLQVGNVRYTGDVEILGSVQDGMLVEVMGNVLIHKNVNSAKVISGRSIIVKNNIIASEIVAGKGSIVTAEIHQILGQLIPQFKQMEAAIHQLQTVSAFKVSSLSQTGLGPLIKILCDGKFKIFSKLIVSLIEKINSGTGLLDPEWVEFAARLHHSFVMAHASHLSMEDFMLASMATEQYYEKSRDNYEGDDCFIQADYVHNSQLYSSGDIFISAPGIYYSKFHAGGNIEVNGNLRGGLIHAAKSVKVEETGTKGGVDTKIIVPAGESIKIRSVMEGTVIQIGSRLHRFESTSSHVFARLDDDGQLLIY